MLRRRRRSGTPGGPDRAADPGPDPRTRPPWHVVDVEAQVLELGHHCSPQGLEFARSRSASACHCGDNRTRGGIGDLGLHLPDPEPAGPRRCRGPGGQAARRRRAAPGRRPRPASEGPGGRAVRPAPDLHPDAPGAQHRRVAGGDHRCRQHPPLRAPRVRDAGDRRPVRPDRAADGPGRPRGDLRRGHAAGPLARLGAVGGGAARDGLPPDPGPARARHHRRLVGDRDLQRRPGPRHRTPAGPDGGHAGGRHRPRAARHDPRAAGRGGLGAGRPQAGRRAGGAAGGRAGGADLGARHRTGRRHPRGDGPRRRRRPDRRAGAGAGRAAAGPDGARRGQGRTPAAQLRRVHRRRHDDARSR